MKETILEARNLTKKYGDLIAVNDVNLAIKKGEIFGLLGPNGAGKTTTLRMIATLLKPAEELDEIRISEKVCFQPSPFLITRWSVTVSVTVVVPLPVRSNSGSI